MTFVVATKSSGTALASHFLGLFSGDAVYDGPLLDQLPESDITAYIQTMKKLRELPVDVVHGGHEPSFGRERLHEIIGAYLRKRDR